MILILSDRFDHHADVVEENLSVLGQDYFRFDLDTQSLQSTYVSYDGITWRISCGSREISLASISKVWLRRAFVEVTLEESLNVDSDFRIWRSEWNKTLAGMYLSLAAARWLNPIKEAFRAENKYLQMQEARNIGLKLPETVVSNQKADLISFASNYGDVALKLMTQDLYIDSENVVKGIYVNKINATDLGNFGDSAENPIVLQKYIDKSFEVRYTVVGDKHYVCRIDSQKSPKASVDWRRYDIPRTPHDIITPPEEVRLKVARLMKTLGLEYGALDFIVSKSGEWYFLEINTMGQWLWIEDLTGLPISTAISEWLAN